MKKNGSGNEISGMQVELKYCEHCGGLWLRQYGIEQVYCASCVPRIAELPAPSKQPQTVKLSPGPNVDLNGRGIDLYGVASRRNVHMTGWQA
jgi:Zn-finger nucleic acid-binding protein